MSTSHANLATWNGWSCGSCWWLEFELARFLWKGDHQWQPCGKGYYLTLPPQWDLKIGRFSTLVNVGIYYQHLQSSASPASQQLQPNCMYAFLLHLGILSLLILIQSFKSEALSFSWVLFPCRWKQAYCSNFRQRMTTRGSGPRLQQVRVRCKHTLRVFFLPSYFCYSHSKPWVYVPSNITVL